MCKMHRYKIICRNLQTNSLPHNEFYRTLHDVRINKNNIDQSLRRLFFFPVNQLFDLTKAMTKIIGAMGEYLKFCEYFSIKMLATASCQMIKRPFLRLQKSSNCELGQFLEGKTSEQKLQNKHSRQWLAWGFKESQVRQCCASP